MGIIRPKAEEIRGSDGLNVWLVPRFQLTDIVFQGNLCSAVRVHDVNSVLLNLSFAFLMCGMMWYSN